MVGELLFDKILVGNDTAATELERLDGDEIR
jgi:hypothetical protein